MSKRKTIDDLIKKLEHEIDIENETINFFRRNVRRHERRMIEKEEKVKHLKEVKGTNLEKIIIILDNDIDEVIDRVIKYKSYFEEDI